jgi:hypothetical protein
MRGEGAKQGRDGGQRCFENNWLGGAGQEREKGGLAWACLHGGGRRRRGGGGAGVAVGSSRVAVRVGSSCAQWRWVAEQGKAAGRGRRGAGAADKRGWVTSGPGSSGRGT